MSFPKEGHRTGPAKQALPGLHFLPMTVFLFAAPEPLFPFPVCPFPDQMLYRLAPT